MVSRVGVTRRPNGLDEGYTWTVTFYALADTDYYIPSSRNSSSSSSHINSKASSSSRRNLVPLLQANISLLTSGSLLKIKSLYTYNPPTPTVTITSLSTNVGNPSVHAIRTYATPVNQVLEISHTFLMKSNSSHYEVEDIDLLVFNPFTYKYESLGTFFPTTVSMKKDEIAGPYPPHGQPAGTTLGQSLQSLLKSLSFFKYFAEDVMVSKINMKVQDVVVVKWKITFINAYTTKNFLLKYHDGLNSLNSDSNIDVKYLVNNNNITGSFQLSWLGYTTTVLPYDCTTDSLREALMSLPSVYDKETGLGG